MKCPIDGNELVMTERSGVEIDYCPKCRGVWLDRGELDKIIDRSAVPAPLSDRASVVPERARGDRAYGNDREYSGQYEKPPKRRESFLSDLFDF